MNYLVLHATHGLLKWDLIYEGNRNEVQKFLLKDRMCPSGHYRIVSVETEWCVLEELREGAAFQVRTW